METALIVLAAILLVVGITAVFFLSTTLIQIVRDMKEILTLTHVNTRKISGIDSLLVAMHTFLIQDMMENSLSSHQAERLPPPGWEEMQIAQEDGKFITEDGVHSATSFEELIGKITKDPRYRVNRPEDIDEIRRKFDDFNEQHGDDFGGDQGMGPPEGPEDISTGDEWKESL